MTSHLGVLILFAAFVSAVFAVLMRDVAAEQVRFGSRVFVSLVLGAYAAGWLMYVAF
jgi:L-cystine uptake protein TcyP (sodium:dicarboxylate symporter family)